MGELDRGTIMIVQNNHAPYVALALVILAGAGVLGALIVNGKPLESSSQMYAAFGTATADALQARSKQAVMEGTETPRALVRQLGQTQSAVAAHAVLTQQSVSAQAAQTQGAVVTQATQTSFALNAQATQTRDAASSRATEAALVAAAQATAISVQQTATQAALRAAVGAAQSRATETAVAVEAQNQVLQAEATQTAVAIERGLAAQAAEATSVFVAQGPLRDAEQRAEVNTRETWIAGAIVAAISVLSASLGLFILMNGRAHADVAAAKKYVEQRRIFQVQAALAARREEVAPKITLLAPPRSRPLAEEHFTEKKAA